MARFTPQEFNINDINGGERFENGQKPQQDAFNAPIEGSAYAIEQAVAAHAKANQALNFAFGSVSGFSPLTAYPIGSVYISVNITSPAELFGGSWEKLKDKFLVGAGNLYALGTTGGSAEHLHTLESGYARISPRTSGWSYYQLTEAPGGWVPTHVSRDADLYEEFDEYGVSGAVKLGGTTDATSTIPPYLAVNIWKRTA